MYIDTSHIRKGDKIYTRHLLRESYRENGKVKHRTHANLSHCSPEEIEAIKLALKHKKDLSQVGSAAATAPAVELKQGNSFGAVWVLNEIAHNLGIAQALGSSSQGKLALWQVIARAFDQGSRLSATRLAQQHAAGDIIGLPRFNENDLYKNLDWLAENQEIIEQKLYQFSPVPHPELFLYDVTSSYLEGTENEYAAFGYNRDRKRGKEQIVIGLLCDSLGRPLSIEVFPGNTQDTKTFQSQIDKIKNRFGGNGITLVGDRGMIKSPQISALKKEEFNFITAITTQQVETLLNDKVLQLDLFDEQICEISDSKTNLRYILRRNPVRAEEIAKTRAEKLLKLQVEIVKKNDYLGAHPRAKAENALAKLQAHAQKLKINKWINVTLADRHLHLHEDTDALAEISQLDGCYVLKTDLQAKTGITKEVIHARYKDLGKVEWAFRTCKMGHLEARPIFVRKKSRTDGHALVVMLAYRIIQELADRWKDIDLNVEEALNSLSLLCIMQVRLPGQPATKQIPEPSDKNRALLRAARIKIPSKVPSLTLP